MTTHTGIGKTGQAPAAGAATRRPPTGKPALGIGLIGHGFMGAVHSHAWRTAPHSFELPCKLSMNVICGRDEERARNAAVKLGWRSAASGWREVIQRADIDIVDICAPPHLHGEIAVAALAAGKHVLCEKPLANSVGDALAMTEAARLARAQGIRSMVGYNYRRLPALALARQLLRDGTVGDPRRLHASYLQDWACGPDVAQSWRFDPGIGGAGALGDLGCHLVDLFRYLCAGDRIQAVACVQTAVRDPGQQRDVDDAAVLLGLSASGIPVSFDVSRVARGYKNALRLELDGSGASLRFDLERMNELQLFSDDVGVGTQGFRRMLISEPGHPYLSGWWPPGHLLGFEHAFVHQVRDFVLSVTSAADPAPSFEDGLAVQLVIAAAQASWECGSAWTQVAHPPVASDGNHRQEQR